MIGYRPLYRWMSKCQADAGGLTMERTLETVQLFGSLFLTLLALFVPITVGVVLLRRWVGPDRLQRWLGGRSLPMALVKGTALGAVTPFCGCSTIPLLLGLLKADVRFAAVAAFVLASPLLNPYILGVVTLLFGWQVAAAYAAVAAVTTVVLAAAWELTGMHRHLKVPGYRPVPVPTREPVRTAAVVGGGSHVAVDGQGAGGSDASCGTSAVDVGCGTEATTIDGPPREAPAGCGSRGATPSCGTAASAEASGSDDLAAPVGGEEAWRGRRIELRDAWQETVELLRPMMVPLVVGLSVGALIYGAVPEGTFAEVLGRSSWLTLPLAALLGLPLYLRGEAAFPIGAGLLAAGVGEGPMFAMVIAGMGASLPEVTILSSIFDRRLLTVFLASVFAMAVAGGALLPLVT
jgi:uncharacterized protein